MKQFLAEWWSGGIKKRAVLIGIPVFLIVIVGAFTIYFLKQAGIESQSGIQESLQQELFEGFSKYHFEKDARDDVFDLQPSASDSLGVEPSSVYILTSKESMNTDTLKEQLRISPETDFALEKKDDGQWELRLAKQPAPNTLVHIALAATQMNADGKEERKNYEWAFQVKDSFKIFNALPRDMATGVPLNTGIEITFSHENFSNYEEYIEMNPRIPGRFEKHGRTLAFVPERLDPGTVYHIRVKKGLPLSGSEETLKEDYVFAFETQTETVYSDSPWIKTFQKIQDVNTFDPPLIQLSARNLKENIVHVTVYPLEGEADYLNILHRRDQLPWWSYSKEAYLETTDGRKPLTSFDASVQEEENVQFFRFTESLPEGYFLAEIANEDAHDQILLQSTDIGAYINVAQNQTVVWTADLRERKPLAGTMIELIGTKKTYSSNQQGVAVFDTPEELLRSSTDLQENAGSYLRISASGKTLILPAASPYTGYRWSEDPSAEYWKYLYTDRPLYQPTDTIQFWGLVKRRDQKRTEYPIVLTLYRTVHAGSRNEQVIIASQTVSVDAFGTFTGSIPIKDIKTDGYILQLQAGERIISSRYIQIQRYEKPAYQLTLIPETGVEYAGKPIALRAQAAFFEGTPVPNLPLVFETPNGEQRVVTNDAGIVDLSYEKSYSDCAGDRYACWPDRAWVSIRPELAEEAEITSGVGLSFYGPSVTAGSKISYPSKGRAKLDVTVRELALEEMRENPYRDTANNAPSIGTRVEGEAIKVTYERKETGTSYDFINKRTYKRYSYTRTEEVVGQFSGVTNEQGVYTYERDVEERTAYRITIKYYDSNGRYDKTTAYAYYYDGRQVNDYEENGAPFYRLQLPEDNAFSIGETVTVDFVNGEERLPDGGDHYYLYLQYQNGFREYRISQSSQYRFPFETRDVPNVNLSGVYFNGEAFVIAETGWVGNSILFSQEDKTLKIETTTDKEIYEPGDTVRLSVQTKNALGNPVSSAVNLNLIDEAFYAVMDTQANPISSIYAGLSSGSVYSSHSHQRPISPYGGAEMGGCFLAGTAILMEEGGVKNIEEIVEGDRILTLEDPRTRHMTVGTVTKTYRHVVSEYLVINNTLRVTPEHLVYANLRFTPAGNLRVGDWMLTSGGETVFVTSIETKREIVPVYNFRADPQHTYFADGYLVHNEKGSGPREFFTDAALFKTITTNSRGLGSVTFTLPDNITSWRVTAQGLSSRLDVGISVSKIPVSLPVFLEATIGKEYVAGDEPVARLRSFGTAFSQDDPVVLRMESPDLGIAEPVAKSSTAFASEFFPLPKLEFGTYKATYALESEKGNDAITLPITVLSSRLSVQSSQTHDLQEDLRISNDEDEPVSILFTDRDRSRIYRTLRDLTWRWGDRIDQKIARTMAPRLLNEAFGASLNIPEFNASQYQLTNGGLTLLPYSGEDLELSARIAQLHPPGFDYMALRQFFMGSFESPKSNKEEITLALYGLAGLKEPILPQLQSWIARDDLTVTERIYSAIAASLLGDRKHARKIYLDILEEYAFIKEPHIVIKAGNTKDEVLKNTELMSVLAACLGEEEEYGLWHYLRYNHPTDVLVYLEELNLAKTDISRLVAHAESVDFEINGKRMNTELAYPHFSYGLTLQKNDSLTVNTSSSHVVLTTDTKVPYADGDLAIDRDMAIRREYYVNGQRTTAFNENELIEVRLYPEFSDNALDGYYQITDTLPSGLLPVTKLYQGLTYYDCHYLYPYNKEGQTVAYFISKKWRDSFCGGDYIRYYARVKNKGEYQAEPVIMQSMLNPDLFTLSSNERVRIQ
jgi:hypothetical protein